MTSKTIKKPEWSGKTTIGGTPQKIELSKEPGLPSQSSLTRVIQNTLPTQLIPNKLPVKKLVLIECPYMAEDTLSLSKNIKYAEACLKDSIARGEAPFLSSLVYSAVLNYRVAVEHDIALISNLSWLHVADLVAVYADYEISPGMQAAINTAMLKMKKIEYRLLGKIVG